MARRIPKQKGNHLEMVQTNSGLWVPRRGKVERDSITESIATAIAKEMKDLSIGTANTIGSTVKWWTPTGFLALDFITGGGSPGGRVIEVLGDFSTGKSYLVYTSIGCAQRMDYLTVLIDSESAFTKKFAARLAVSPRNLILADDIDTVEDGFLFIDKFIKAARKRDSTRPILIAWDSLAATSSKEEMEKKVGEAMMPKRAKLISQAMRKLQRILKRKNVSLMIVNQIRDSINSYGGADSTGGRAVKFHAAQRWKLSRVKKLKQGDRIIGVKIKVEIIKNKIVAPFRSTTFTLRFDGDYNPCEGLSDALIAEGTTSLRKAKGWYKLPDEEFGADDTRKRGKIMDRLLGENYDEVRGLLDE